MEEETFGGGGSGWRKREWLEEKAVREEEVVGVGGSDCR